MIGPVFVAVTLMLGQAIADITWPPGEITLADGAQCTFRFGATFGATGQRADYDCGDGRWLTSSMVELPDGSVTINALSFDQSTGKGSFLGPVTVDSTSCQAIQRIPDVDSTVVCG